MGVLAAAVCVLAVAPALLIVANLTGLPRRRRRPAPARGRAAGAAPTLSVLIPARNESAHIGAALGTVLACRDPSLEVLVLDDRSTDATASIVRAAAARDPRVRLVAGREPPPGACGKPFACAELARHATGEVLLFIDADVRLAPHAPLEIGAALAGSRAAMISGFPRQRTGTLGEKLIVPLMHLVLFAYLPLVLMRRFRHPSLGAACGQVCAVARSAYFETGGHAAIVDRVHDGIALARHLRMHGHATDIVDLDGLAFCRMYTSWAEVVAGFAKNAHEGLGSPRGILPWTALLVGGQVLPAVLLPLALAGAMPLGPVALALTASLGGRFLVSWRFGQSWLGAALHPVGVAALVAIQWYALGRRLAGRPFAWKGRLIAGGA